MVLALACLLAAASVLPPLRAGATPTSLVTRRQLLGATAALLAAPRASRAAKISSVEARKQIRDGYLAIDKLLQDFPEITEREGGDGVRRVLGTVGTTSPVYRIEAAFRSLTEETEEPPDYLDGLEELMRYLQDADAQAYSANFITFSSAKGTPEQYFARSKQAVSRAKEEWSALLKMLGVEL
eukprot:scaffold314429_cov32-Tisochrysis_lutea.AAC.6